MADHAVPQPDDPADREVRPAGAPIRGWKVIVYCFGVSVVCATGVIAWGRFAGREHIDLAVIAVWQAASYGYWVLATPIVSRLLARGCADPASIVRLVVAGLALASVHAIWAVALDRTFSLAPLSWAGGFAARWPLSMLTLTAIAAAAAAFLSWRNGERLLRLLKDMERRAEGDAVSRSPLLVDLGTRKVIVPVDAVEWIGSAGNYAVIHWQGQEGLVRETLNSLEGRLGFVRIHRSILVNLAKVESASVSSDGGWRIRMPGETDLLVARSQRHAVLARLGLD